MTENQTAARSCTDIDFGDLDDIYRDYADRKPDEYDKVHPAVWAKFKKDCEGFEIINHDDVLMYLEVNIDMLNSIARIKHAILKLAKPERVTLDYLLDPEEFVGYLCVDIYLENNGGDKLGSIDNIFTEALEDALSWDVYTRVIPTVH